MFRRNACLAAILYVISVMSTIAGYSGAAVARELSSGWQKSYASRARLIAGVTLNAQNEAQVLAGVHIEMKTKWKTYWRQPGDAGGVPPTFDWGRSKNLKDVEVLYPAPERLVSEYGENIGYHSSVVLPVKFSRIDPSKPVTLNATFSYGVCDDICVPAKVELSLVIPASVSRPAPGVLRKAFLSVPRLGVQIKPTDPRVTSATIVKTEGEVKLVIDVEYSKGDTLVDVFVEGPSKVFLPMTKADKTLSEGTKRFVIDLESDIDLATLRGQKLRVTAVSDSGHSEAFVEVN